MKLNINQAIKLLLFVVIVLLAAQALTACAYRNDFTPGRTLSTGVQEVYTKKF